MGDHIRTYLSYYYLFFYLKESDLGFKKVELSGEVCAYHDLGCLQHQTRTIMAKQSNEIQPPPSPKTPDLSLLSLQLSHLHVRSIFGGIDLLEVL